MKKEEKLPTEKSITTTPFPGSKKIYVKGKLHNIEVAMREITVSSGVSKKNPAVAPLSGGEGKGERLAVYDTSGPYTDP
ncbi:MAG: phosphomethylpyrimidine synthase ThiC, partial [Crocinitomicaceae bacterium]|nr:phosphomethylpyrimidine synthase ThiC [Crocinitomicaceae bacterium]